MAQFCARVRKRADLPSVSMKDVYQHPTIRSLATALTDAAPTPVEPSVPAPTEVARPASTRQYVLCGVLQVLIFLGYTYFAALIFERGFDLDFRRIGCGRRLPAGGPVRRRRSSSWLSTLPILVKWMLIGRWTPQQIPIWSLAYVRFWVVKTLVRANPLVLFAGSPLYVLYLRALGAKVGRGVGDLLPARARVHRPVHHRRRHGRPQGLVLQLLPSPWRPDPDGPGHPRQGRVRAARRRCSTSRPRLATEPNSAMPRRCTRGRPCPAGERWHGSPGERTEADYRAVDTAYLQHQAQGRPIPPWSC